MRQLHINIKDEMAEKLEKLAKKQERSLSNLVRYVLLVWLRAQK